MVIINNLMWYFVNDGTLDHVGLIPSFLAAEDPRPAKEQLDAAYISGWRPFKGHTMDNQFNLQYPEDPPTRPLALTKLRNEMIVVYEHAWVAIIQQDRQFEVCRMD